MRITVYTSRPGQLARTPGPTDFGDAPDLDRMDPHEGEVRDSDNGSTVYVPTARCPVCADLWEFVSVDGVVRALARPDRLPEARKGLEADGYAGCREFAPDPSAVFRVRLPRPVEGRDGWSGSAECVRCKSTVGIMVVRTDTMWGLEEDRRVLSGRCRVY